MPQVLLNGYTPSPAAVRTTIQGAQIAWDIFQFDPTEVALILAELRPDGIWATINAVSPDNREGILWKLMGANGFGVGDQEYNHITEAHLNGAGFMGAFFQQVNKWGSAMVDDYAPTVNQLIPARFQLALPTRAPPQPGQFTNDIDARQFLAGALLKWKFDGPVLALK